VFPCFGKNRRWTPHSDARKRACAPIPIFKLLSQCYSRLLGRPLVPEHVPIEDAPRWLYESAPIVQFAHNPNTDIPGQHCPAAPRIVAYDC
jgi:hypothetical protein